MFNDRVAVAMSGGVDSSVAAAFLKEKGYDVVGLTMTLSGNNSRCCSIEDVEDARRVAQHIGIPHYVFSLKESFKKKVIDYFIAEYLRGRTPNPCAVCNQAIKFGDLLQKAKALGARFLATGHYALVTYNQERKRYLLRQGKERGKDQSYFLARLSQEALSSALFPVGSFPKAKIRKLAENFGLPVANKTESQEVCFIPDGKVAEFIEEQRGRQFAPGPIIDGTGQVLGTHRGIIGYTIGQRKGLGISVGKPIYVTAIDAEKNTVFVGEPEKLYHQRFTTIDPNWISLTELKKPIRAKVKIRYKHKPGWATVKPLNNEKIEVEFESPQRAITPGQLAVFYDHDIVLGSAWIDRILE